MPVIAAPMTAVIALCSLSTRMYSASSSPVSVYSAVWDPGYSGRAEALLVVHNPHGFGLKQGARVVQLVFTRLGEPVASRYKGRFHRENI